MCSLRCWMWRDCNSMYFSRSNPIRAPGPSGEEVVGEAGERGSEAVTPAR